MSLWTVLLRMLLCVGLILNGSGTAVASARMQVTHVQPARAVLHSHAAGDSADAAKPDCHERAVSTAEGGHDACDTDSEPLAHQAPNSHSPDCCETGACQCDCAHQIQVLATPNPRDIEVEPTGNVRSMMWAHVPPSLSHLIRPPIHPVS